MEDVKWMRSAFCGDAGSCVEIAFVGGDVFIRDSKLEDSPVLKFTQDEYKKFVAGAAESKFLAV